MKNYTITVNGTAYDVVVEEKEGGAATVAQDTVSKAAPVPQAQGSAGAVKVTASVPGKVFKVEVKAGQTVKAGDTIVILESMKMEIPVVAPQDGTVASVDVTVGDSVENGDTLASMD